MMTNHFPSNHLLERAHNVLISYIVSHFEDQDEKVACVNAIYWWKLSPQV